MERTREDTGQRLAELLAEKVTFGGNEVWAWQRDALGRRCGYVSLDATGVPQQGEGGANADGMAYVGTLYNPDSEHDEKRWPKHQVRYLAGFYGLPELGLQLRRQAGQIGWDEVEQQIALSDGGSGLENFLRVHFPPAVCIIDFYHASEHLTELGKALMRTTSRCKRWTDEHCHRLKHEGGATVVANLETIDVSTRSGFFQEEHHKHLQFFRNHLHRMDYPTYLANGWQIGSGRGVRMQDRGGQPTEGRRDAMGRTRIRRRLPSAGFIPQSAHPIGGVLARPTQLNYTTNKTLTRKLKLGRNGIKCYPYL